MNKFFAALAAGFAALFATTKAQGSIVANKIPASLTGADWYDWLTREAQRYRIPQNIALAQIWKESGGRENALGSAGEYGLFQLKQGVAQDFTRVNGYTLNIFATRDNITLGLWYLSFLRDHYNLTLNDALLAYNSGIGNFLAGRIQDTNYANSIIERAAKWA